MSVAVRAEADEGDGQCQQTEEKCHPRRIMGYIISKVSDWVPDSHESACK